MSPYLSQFRVAWYASFLVPAFLLNPPMLHDPLLPQPCTPSLEQLFQVRRTPYLANMPSPACLLAQPAAPPARNDSYPTAAGNKISVRA